MNTIKLSGKIIKKEKIKNDNSQLKIVLAMPLQMKVFDADMNSFKQCCNHLSFTIVGLEKEQYENLRKGNQVEIVGTVCSNCTEDGTITNDLCVFIKTVTKGVK